MMSKKESLDLIKEAEAFLTYNISGKKFICKYCDPDVNYICEFCQSLDIIKRLKDGLKKINDEETTS